MAKNTDAAEPVAFSTNIHNIFHTDQSLEEDGVWVTLNDLQKLKIKIRRLRSDAVIKAFERIVRETYDDAMLRNPQGMTEEQSMHVLERQLAEAVLIDWSGVRDAKTGEEIPYSPQAALQLVKIRDFREFVYEAANNRDTFREKADKEAEGNS